MKISKIKLKHLYLKEKLSSKKIAEEFNCSKSTILKNLHQYNIPLRKAKIRIDIPKSQLKNLYINKKLSMAKVAEKLSVNPTTIHERLHEYDLFVRSINEALSGRIPWNKGKYASEKTKKKLSKISKKRWKDPEFKRKMEIRNRKLSELMNGDRNPMKKTEARKKVSRKMMGKLTGDKNPAKKIKVRKKISKALKGHKVLLETREKISKSLKGKYAGELNPFYGKHHTERVKEKSRKRAVRQLASGEIGKTETSIELKIEKELKRKSVKYKKQVSLLGATVVDFYLPRHRVVIYCDGVFWHHSDWAKENGVIEKDKKQNRLLENNGYKVFRFSGTKINESAKRCVDEVIENMEKE